MGPRWIPRATLLDDHLLSPGSGGLPGTLLLGGEAKQGAPKLELPLVEAGLFELGGSWRAFQTRFGDLESHFSRGRLALMSWTRKGPGLPPRNPEEGEGEKGSEPEGGMEAKENREGSRFLNFLWVRVGMG